MLLGLKPSSNQRYRYGATSTTSIEGVQDPDYEDCLDTIPQDVCLYSKHDHSACYAACHSYISSYKYHLECLQIIRQKNIVLSYN